MDSNKTRRKILKYRDRLKDFDHLDWALDHDTNISMALGVQGIPGRNCAQEVLEAGKKTGGGLGGQCFHKAGSTICATWLRIPALHVYLIF